MFFFVKKKPLVVNFFTTDEAVFKFSRPERAAKFMPEWFKALPKQVFKDNFLAPKSTLRTCPGFIELYKSGFIIPAWSDFNLEIGADYYKFLFADEKSTVAQHNLDQIANSPFVKTHLNAKLINPWSVKSEEKVKLLFTAPTWNDFGFDDISIVPGVTVPDKFLLSLNINLFLKLQSEAKIYSIKFGQPLCHVVPLTDRQIDLRYELITPAEYERISLKHPYKFFFTNRFKRASELCPHAK